MDGKFDSDYYVAIATVVPLLYITLFLQGQLMQKYSKRIGEAIGEQMAAYFSVTSSWFRGEYKIQQIRVLAKSIFFFALYLTISIYVVLGSYSA